MPKTPETEGFPALTKKDFADTVGISIRQVDNLVVEGLPRIKQGRRYVYPPAAITWYFQRKLEGERGERPPALDEAKARKELAEAELAEMRVAQARKEMVPIELLQEELGFVLEKVRAQLLNLPGRLAPMIIGLKTYGEAKLKLEQVTAEAMLELMRTSEDLDIPPSKNGDYKAAGNISSATKRRPTRRKKGAKKKGSGGRKRKVRSAS